MNAKRTDAQWNEIDPNTLPEGHKMAYENYKVSYRLMKEAREGFERGMNMGVPAGERMIFGYNFGKLSVAIVPDDRKPKASTKVKSLTEYLAERQAAGQAS